ncbi:V-set and transmembrane domain-containing protein 2A-like isoform X1, partial [Lates japonicus]
VVKVVGSNISHKLRLSRVKPSDEGTYECRVIDFSDDAGARHHRVRAYLQVVPESDIIDTNHNNNFEALDDTKREVGFVDGDDVDSHGGTREHAHGHHQNHGHHQEHGKRSSSPAHHGHSHSHSGSSQQQKAGRELRKRDVDSNHSHNDCTNEPSCAL